MPNSHKLRKDSKNVNFKIGPLGPKKLSQIFNMPIIKSVARTICGTPVQAILDQKNLARLAGGAREGQNMAHLGHFNGKCAQMHYFDLP